MNENAGHPVIYRSVFVKLVTAMLAMTACLVVLVVGFFVFVFKPKVDVHTAGTLHTMLLVLLLCLMAGVVLATHVVLRRALRPLKTLQFGVARLSEGELDVVLPVETSDEFRMLTDGFNRMVGRVRDMVSARDQLLRDVSHEMRSPLTRLKVALELLPDGDRKTQMSADVAEMEAMIAELLELERLREDRNIRKERHDLAPILDEVADLFGDRPPGVRVVSADPTLVVDVDREKMRGVLRNIIENAVKYSLPDSRPVEISAARSGAHVVITVKDDGPGIPPADLANVFEPFFRVDRSRSRRTGGYGLGLSICRRVMEAHGGSIAVENNPGRGASFILGLPAERIDQGKHGA